jgi:hypothetical protein
MILDAFGVMTLLSPQRLKTPESENHPELISGVMR